MNVCSPAPCRWGAFVLRGHGQGARELPVNVCSPAHVRSIQAGCVRTAVTCVSFTQQGSSHGIFLDTAPLLRTSLRTYWLLKGVARAQIGASSEATLVLVLSFVYSLWNPSLTACPTQQYSRRAPKHCCSSIACSRFGHTFGMASRVARIAVVTGANQGYASASCMTPARRNYSHLRTRSSSSSEVSPILAIYVVAPCLQDRI